MADDIDPIVPQPNPAALPQAAQDTVRALLSGVGGVAQHIGQLPQRAFEASEQLRNTGEYNPAPIVETAQLLAGGGAPMAEAGAAGIFGGRLARGANLPLMHRAEMMERLGADPSEIHFGTGWFRGADGQWRFEIPDQGATFSRDKDVLGPHKMGSLVAHPELYKNYPQLAERKVTMDRGPNQGVYRPMQGGTFGLSAFTDDNKQLPIALHELQHGVQHIEGFAPGTNQDAMLPYTLQAFVKNKLLTPEKAEEIRKTRTADAPVGNKLNDAIQQAYLRHAGEVEANNVQTRQPYTNIERMAIPPWATQSHPYEQQIVRPPSPQSYLLNALYK